MSLTCVKFRMETGMRKIVWGLAGLVIVVVLAFAGVLAFDSPAKPPTLA